MSLHINPDYYLSVTMLARLISADGGVIPIGIQEVR